MAFDTAGAKAAGYSDQEIQQYLSSKGQGSSPAPTIDNNTPPPASTGYDPNYVTQANAQADQQSQDTGLRGVAKGVANIAPVGMGLVSGLAGSVLGPLGAGVAAAGGYGAGNSVQSAIYKLLGEGRQDPTNTTSPGQAIRDNVIKPVVFGAEQGLLDKVGDVGALGPEATFGQKLLGKTVARPAVGFGIGAGNQAVDNAVSGKPLGEGALGAGAIGAAVNTLVPGVSDFLGGASSGLQKGADKAYSQRAGSMLGEFNLQGIQDAAKTKGLDLGFLTSKSSKELSKMSPVEIQNALTAQVDNVNTDMNKVLGKTPISTDQFIQNVSFKTGIPLKDPAIAELKSNVNRVFTAEKNAGKIKGKGPTLQNLITVKSDLGKTVFDGQGGVKPGKEALATIYHSINDIVDTLSGNPEAVASLREKQSFLKGTQDNFSSYTKSNVLPDKGGRVPIPGMQQVKAGIRMIPNLGFSASRGVPSEFSPDVAEALSTLLNPLSKAGIQTPQVNSFLQKLEAAGSINGISQGTSTTQQTSPLQRHSVSN